MEIQTNFWTFLGLGIALFGSLIASEYKKNAKIDVNDLASRFFLWFLVVLIFLILFYGEKGTLISIGFKNVTSRTFLIGILGGVGLMVIMAIIQVIYRKKGNGSPENNYEKIIKLSYPYRIFIVLTAAFAEEILYRGYAIERLSLFTHNIWIAGIISTIFFTVAHIYAWSLRHLIPVFLSGLFLAILYIIERDIVACIIAHFIVDSVAFIVMPILIKRKK
ncbi:CPBP family intramembrane metalloprotease [bacterium SCSIO 12643]|nr:CPBP family intramembrane metalloprotease [bacterium SCSIO 12643]